MERCLLFFFVIFINSVSVGQIESFRSIQINDHEIFPVDLTSHQSSKYPDFSKVKSAVGSSDIVVISEPDHGDYSAISNRQSLVEYLHDSCGFNALITEYSFFLLNAIGEDTCCIDFDRFNNLTDSTYYWDYLPDLFDWVEKERENGTPIILTGCDIHTYYYFLDFIKSRIGEIDSEIANSEKFRWFYDYCLNLTEGTFRKNKKLEKSFQRYCNFLIDIFIQKDPNNICAQYLLNLKTEISNYFLSRYKSDRKTLKEMNNRDKQMADNIIWLTEHKLREQKIIISISSYHAMRNISSISSRQIRRSYPVAQYLSDYFGDRLYSIAGIGYKGRPGRTPDHLYFLCDKDSSYLEHKLYKAGYKQAFIDFRSFSNQEPFNMNNIYALPHIHYAVWNEVYDGILFTDSIRPAFMVFPSKR